MSEEREGFPEWMDMSFQAEAIEDLVFSRDRIIDDGFLECMTEPQKAKVIELVNEIQDHINRRILPTPNQ